MILLAIASLVLCVVMVYVLTPDSRKPTNTHGHVLSADGNESSNPNSNTRNEKRNANSTS